MRLVRIQNSSVWIIQSLVVHVYIQKLIRYSLVERAKMFRVFRKFRIDNSSYFTGFETRLPIWLCLDADFTSCNFTPCCGGVFNILLHYAGNDLITIRLHDASSFTRFVASGCCTTDRELICAVMATITRTITRITRETSEEDWSRAKKYSVNLSHHALLWLKAKKDFLRFV